MEVELSDAALGAGGGGVALAIRELIALLRQRWAEKKDTAEESALQDKIDTLSARLDEVKDALRDVESQSKEDMTTLKDALGASLSSIDKDVAVLKTKTADLKDARKEDAERFREALGAIRSVLSEVRSRVDGEAR